MSRETTLVERVEIVETWKWQVLLKSPLDSFYANGSFWVKNAGKDLPSVY